MYNFQQFDEIPIQYSTTVLVIKTSEASSPNNETKTMRRSLEKASEAANLFKRYRTDHLEGTSLLADAEDRPSFVYTMPTDDDGVFFEETSLVGRDERRLEFETLRQRLLKRLEFHGIKYDESAVREEEYCYIPMGGALPDPSQRLVPFGGAANTVHPATGYQL